MSLAYTAQLLNSSSTDLYDNMYVIPEGDFMSSLKEIIVRHRNYVSAKASGKLGTSKETISQLKGNSATTFLSTESDSETPGSGEVSQSPCESHQAENEGEMTCSLCLESMEAGDKVLRLPCGHVFHAGHSNNNSSGEEEEEGSLELKQVKVGKKRALRAIDRETSSDCRGILYWLENNTSCPHCRFSLPTELPVPNKSESILVPLLHRQNRVITKQSELIKEQQKQIEELKRTLNSLNNYAGVSKASSTGGASKTKRRKVELCTSQTQPTPSSRFQEMKNSQFLLNRVPHAHQPVRQHNFYLPRLSWQDSTSPTQQAARKEVLRQVTSIALNDIVVRGTMDEQAKNTKLHELAAKVELILYCCSPSFAFYADHTSLRQRTLNTVRSLAEKARALKMQSGNPGIALRFQQ